MKKKITFILPFYKKISGGHKMVYEYANRMSKDDYEITILIDCKKIERKYRIIPKKLKYAVCKYYVCKTKKWYNLQHKVSLKCILGINDDTVPDGDIVWATAIDTVKGVYLLSQNKGKKMYFIQGYEAWGNWTEEQVDATYNLGMKNVVIAKWLYNKVVDTGAEAVLLPNAIDTTIFRVQNPIQNRNKFHIAMMYRTEAIKGSCYGIAAFVKLKEKYPQLIVTLFGNVKRPKNLPSWIKYIYNANQYALVRIYNEASIYMYPAIKEGFGLTGAEAMACGCAYVSSDYGGVHEYTVPGRNVLLSDPKDVQGLVDNVSYLIENNDKRIELANNGYHDIQALDWQKNIIKLESIIDSLE